MLASQYGYVEIVSLLVAGRANVNAISKVNGICVLILCILYFVCDDMLHTVFKYQDSSTALTKAAEQGHRKIVSILLAKGANVNAHGQVGNINFFN